MFFWVCVCAEVEHRVSAPSHGQWASWTNGVGMLWASIADSRRISVVDVVLGNLPLVLVLRVHLGFAS